MVRDGSRVSDALTDGVDWTLGDGSRDSDALTLAEIVLTAEKVTERVSTVDGEPVTTADLESEGVDWTLGDGSRDSDALTLAEIVLTAD